METIDLVAVYIAGITSGAVTGIGFGAFSVMLRWLKKSFALSVDAGDV